MELPVAQGEALNDLDEAGEWQHRAGALLDTYLREFGILAGPARARWIERVIENLDVRAETVATEDILEEAVERMRTLIEARVAAIRGHDPERDHREIAQILAVLLGEDYTHCLSLLFERVEPDESSGNIELVRNALVTALPVPVPEESPLAMPEQTIELRSINPLRWLPGHSA
jgi:hypothetical protein